MTFDELLREFGLPLAALAIIVTSGYRRIWVWGWALRDAEARETRAIAERDEWKAVALEMLHVNRKIVSS